MKSYTSKAAYPLFLSVFCAYSNAYGEIKMVSMDKLHEMSDVVAIVEVVGGSKVSRNEFVVTGDQGATVKGDCPGGECVIEFSLDYGSDLPRNIGSTYLVYLNHVENDKHRLVRFPAPSIKISNVQHERSDIQLVIKNLGVDDNYVVHDGYLWFPEECSDRSGKFLCDLHMEIMNSFFERLAKSKR